MFDRILCLTFKAPKTTIGEFANRTDPDEASHREPPYLDLHCLPFHL